MSEREDDMHYRNVATVLGIPIADVTPDQRAVAKRVCFGCRGEDDAREQLEMYLRIALSMREKRKSAT